jgi:hypothetical protein
MFWVTMQGLVLFDQFIDRFFNYLTTTSEMRCRMLGLFKNGQIDIRKEAAKA